MQGVGAGLEGTAGSLGVLGGPRNLGRDKVLALALHSGAREPQASPSRPGTAFLIRKVEVDSPEGAVLILAPPASYTTLDRSRPWCLHLANRYLE